MRVRVQITDRACRTMASPWMSRFQAFATPTAANQTMAPLPLTLQIGVGATGGGAAVDIRNPFVGVTFVIALEGIFPTRN